ncbi:TonB-dependent receptor [Methylocystis bryophila]|uniref:TonB-dependent receptor n=1 Tax=Methylocystis bryophila TaxID=655015 RepID=A0A1W6MTR1_9HYPH|nr:TonB-dependent receptor plug domain-containing protein [Methylocystis bryophila]ARN80957.1 TonB-dependent receptor [Methylocystis bryophila]BDV36860.1 TonB-dependent receptor [Methylocystis bryophila]
MSRSQLMRGASLAIIMLASTATAQAETVLPVVNIGAARHRPALAAAHNNRRPPAPSARTAEAPAPRSSAPVAPPEAPVAPPQAPVAPPKVITTLGNAIVTHEEVEAVAPRTSDTAQLLRDVPGAAVYNNGGVSGLPVLDGLGDDRLHVTIGGVPVLSACANHMNPPLSYIAPFQVGDIRVFNNIVPVSVGGDSVGGAILVDPAPPAFASPAQPLLTKGEIGSYFRSNGSAYGGNLSTTAATQNFSLSYKGSYARSQNYTAGGNFQLWHPAYLWTNNTLPFTITGAFTPWLNANEVGSTSYQAQNHDIVAAFQHENHSLKVDFSLQHIPYQNYPNQRMDMTENRSIIGNALYQGVYDWGSLEAQAYYQAIRHIMDFNADKQYYYGSLTTILAPGMPMDTAAQNAGGKLRADIVLTDVHKLKVGGEVQQYHYDEWWPPSPAILPPRYKTGGMAPWSFQNINNGQRNRIDVFAELESRWNPEWMTQLGVRNDTVFMSTDPVHGYNPGYDSGPLFPATKFNAANRSRIDQNWDLTAQTVYTPNAMQTYTIGYSQKARSPNLYERYAWSPAIMPMEMIGWFGDGNYYVGNLNLQPEIAHTASATADWHDPARGLSLQVTPYFTYISNYIDVQRCPPWVCGTSAMNNLTGLTGFVSLQFINQNARIFGVDASARALLAKDTPLGDFTAKGILGYVNGQNTVTGGSLYQMMPINSKLSLEQTLWGWTNAVEAELVGAKNRVEQVRNEVKTGGYTLINLRSTYEWKNIRVDFGVENVFNSFYYLPLGGAYVGYGATMSGPLPVGPAWGIAVPGMGRSFYVATRVKF